MLQIYNIMMSSRFKVNIVLIMSCPSISIMYLSTSVITVPQYCQMTPQIKKYMEMVKKLNGIQQISQLVENFATTP